MNDRFINSAQGEAILNHLYNIKDNLFQNHPNLVDVSGTTATVNDVSHWAGFYLNNGDFVEGSLNHTEFYDDVWHQNMITLEPGIYNGRMSLDVSAPIYINENGVHGTNGYGLPIIIDDTLTDYNRMFDGCAMFNQPINIPDTVTNCYAILRGCYTYNMPTTIPSGVISCASFFSGCTNFNAPVTVLANNISDLSYMFYNCIIYNQSVDFGGRVANVGINGCYYMYGQCLMFNCAVNIPAGITNCGYMFYNCKNLNKPITIPNGVEKCQYMFSGCSNFNQPVTIPNSVTHCLYMFYECSKQNCQINVPSRFNYQNGVNGWSTAANRKIVWY